MHDPNTLAFRIGQWLEVWHVDPCIGGDDDSAGWSSPKLSDADRENVEEITTHGTDKRLFAKSNLEVIMWIWGRCVYWKYKINRPLTLAEIEYCTNLATNTVDNLDYPLERVRSNPESARGVVLCVYRAMLRHHRKWWQHPRWNVSRWRVELKWPAHFAIGRSSGEVETDW